MRSKATRQPSLTANRIATVRMKYIHDALAASRYPNAKQLARELEVSAQTIRRDMECMRSQMKASIEYDEIKHGFYYTHPPDSWPMFQAREGEILALFLLRKFIAQYEGTSFAAKLEDVFGKLSRTLESQISVPLADIDRCIAFWPFGTLIEFDADIWERLCQAALHRREVILEHKRGNSSAWNERRLAPYTVFEHKDGWYVCGRDIKSAKIKCFSLSRVRKVRQTEDQFVRPEGFSLTGFLADTFGVYRGTGDYHVRVEFDHFAAQFVRLRRWHRSQKLTEGKNGALIVEFDLDNLTEVQGWVMSWGRHARVLEPPDFIAKFRQDLKGALAQYD